MRTARCSKSPSEARSRASADALSSFRGGPAEARHRLCLSYKWGTRALSFVGRKAPWRLGPGVTRSRVCDRAVEPLTSLRTGSLGVRAATACASWHCRDKLPQPGSPERRAPIIPLTGARKSGVAVPQVSPLWGLRAAVHPRPPSRLPVVVGVPGPEGHQPVSVPIFPRPPPSPRLSQTSLCLPGTPIMGRGAQPKSKVPPS